MRYYVEFGGGLGDIFYQIYTNGTYNALAKLQDGEHAVIGLITHNPFAAELFRFHPQRSRMEVRDLGYWLPECDDANRRVHGLPPHAAVRFAAGPVPCRGPVSFYPSEDDLEVIRSVVEEARSRTAPLVVFAVSAGESYKSLPSELVPHLVAAVKDAGALPVFVGRTYPRNDRHELRGPWMSHGMDVVDRLTVPGTAALVQKAAGAVCCHSSISMLAWMERKPQLLLYPKALFEEFIRPRTLWAVGIDYPETVHGLFGDYGESMMERFLTRVQTSAGLAPGQLVKTRSDVHEFLKTLPHTSNPASGEDYTRAEWFTAETGYPFYVRAAETIRPESILEIGSLLGFGLAAFIRGFPAVKRVAALDNESYIRGSQLLCRENLEFYQGEKSFPASFNDIHGHYDLIHVDADHSFAGALCDIAFAWGLGPRVLLVDDYLFLGDVRDAADAFAAHHALTYLVWKSYRGWAVFAKPDALSCLPQNL